MDSSEKAQSSQGLIPRKIVSKNTLRETDTKKSSDKLEDHQSKFSSIRKEHSEYIRSCFDSVDSENELRKKHEEKMNSAIDSYVAETSIDDKEKKVIFNQYYEDFEVLLTDYKIFSEKSNSEQNRVLEITNSYYVLEMDKNFVVSKSISEEEMLKLHEASKHLSHNKLETELSPNSVNNRMEEMFNNSIEKIYYEYMRKYVKNAPAIGIDLGTTYSCVGVMNRGEVHIISNMYGSKTTPSYISFKEDGEEIVGKSAKEQAHENPANTFYEVKRMIGRKYNETDIQNDMKLWPFNVIDENGLLKVKLYSEDCKTLYPEELSAKLLSKLKSDAEKFLKTKVKSAVITVPAYFNDSQRQTTKEAGRLAELKVLQILNEPTAAAIAFNHQIRDGIKKNVLVYDIGGGTFDVSVVVIQNEVINVRAVGGDTHLGGVDFDQRVLNFLIETFKEKFNEVSDDQKKKRALQRLKIKWEQKKWELSEMNSTNIIIDELLPGWDLNYKITRKDFEDLCADLFEKTINIVDETLRFAEMEANDINEVVLIGGSTKIPKIQSLLEEYFKDKPLNNELNPDEAVAYGATIRAALLNGETDSNEFIVYDVSPLSLGIQQYDKTMSVIIPRNSRIPISKSKTFETAEDYGETVTLSIYEGENVIAKENRLLGEFIIDGIARKLAGEETVDVTMEIDYEGILHIKAVSSNGSSQLTVKEHTGRISAVDLKKLANQGASDDRSSLIKSIPLASGKQENSAQERKPNEKKKEQENAEFSNFKTDSFKSTTTTKDVEPPLSPTSTTTTIDVEPPLSPPSTPTNYRMLPNDLMGELKRKLSQRRDGISGAQNNTERKSSPKSESNSVMDKVSAKIPSPISSSTNKETNSKDWAD